MPPWESAPQGEVRMGDYNAVTLQMGTTRRQSWSLYQRSRSMTSMAESGQREWILSTILLT